MKKWIMKAQNKLYKGYLKQGSLSNVTPKIHLTTFVHHFFFTFLLLFLFFFFFALPIFFLSFQTFLLFLLVNYKSNEIDANIMLTSVGRWPLFRVIRKKFWFCIGSKWVMKEDNFFLIKKHGHTSFQLMIVLISKALIQMGKKSITLEVVPCLPLHFFVLFLFFFCLNFFLDRLLGFSV